MRRVLVVAIAAVLGSGVWSTIAASASPASSVRSIPSPAPPVAVEVEVAPVCPAEQIEAAGDVAPSADGSTVVSFTLVDPRCTS